MHRILVLAWVALSFAACREPAPDAGISDERFIEIVVALRQQADSAGDDAARYTAARDQLLAEHGVTYDMLKTYAEIRSRDLARFASVWETINQRLARTQDP